MIDEELLRFRTAVTLVLKDLRKQLDVSQADVNAGIQDQFGFTQNMGRIELGSNFTLETFYMFCKYFKISEAEFFNLVNNVDDQKIDDYLKFKAERKRSRNKKNN